MLNTTVIGDGGWGTALALVLHANGHRVRVWGAFPEYTARINASKENTVFLPGVRLPENIRFLSEPGAAVQNADVVVLASPSEFYSSVLDKFKDTIPTAALVVSVTKGLDRKTHRRMTELAELAIGSGPVATLSGPSFADEVARRIPTAVLIACSDTARAKNLQRVFSSDIFRVYTSDDPIGTELGGALKNVVAIAAGVSDGIGYGHNSKAALITRGLAEMKRLGCALGAKPETFSGLSGMGDLLLTCTGKLSRNRSVGERLGGGEKIGDILGSMKQVAEGVWNSTNVQALAREHNVDVPIAEQVYAIIHDGKDPHDAVQSLLARDLKPEAE